MEDRLEPHRVDAVLFDLDGVLVDSRVPFARSVNAALVAHGIEPLPEAQLHGFLGPPLHSTFRTLVGDDALVEPCVDAYRARYRSVMAEETPIFDGIDDALAELAARVPLVVATSKARALAEPLLEALGLRRHFLAVVGPELAALEETKTETVARALRELPAGSERVAMVGDRRFDMAAARHHGLHGIGALWGIGSADELRAAGADVLAERPADLPALLA
jgi:phosphoglycolate phosphatase